MRVVHIDRQRSWTGQISRAHAVARGLQRRGHDVALIVSPGSILGARGREAGLEVLEVPMRGWRAYPAVLRTRRWLRRWTPDVLHSHGPRDHLLSVLATRGARTGALVRTKHNHSRLRSGAFSRWPFRATARVVAVSDFVRGNLVADGIPEQKVVTIRDAIRIEDFEPRPKDEALLAAHDLQDVDVLVGSVSSLHPRKGVEEILRGYAHFRRLLPEANVRCVLVGRRWEPWVALVRELGLQDEVVFPGFQSDVATWMALLDVFVLPSRHEALGTSVLEAMCMQRAVLVSDAGGIPEAVAPGTGIVLSDLGPDSMGRALRDLVVDAARRDALGVAARRRVLGHFGLERMLDETEALYDSLDPGA